MLLDILKDREFLDLNYVTMKSLPKIGYIALMHKQPIAAGFLRRVEGGYGQIDTLASNPYFGGMIRHDGITKVITALIQDAKDLKLHGIIAFTADEGVLKRAKEIKFQVVDQTLIALKLL